MQLTSHDTTSDDEDNDDGSVCRCFASTATLSAVQLLLLLAVFIEAAADVGAANPPAPVVTPAATVALSLRDSGASDSVDGAVVDVMVLCPPCLVCGL